MRILRALLLAGLAAAPASAAGAYAVLFDWQGNGRSEVFTIGSKVGSWRAVWDCEPRSGATIAILSAENGVPVDFLGASYRGERLITKTGRFQLDSRGTFCHVTVTTLE